MPQLPRAALALVVALTAVLGLASAAPAGATPRVVDHVNLGDSYSAAVGTGGEGPVPPLGCVQGQGPDHVSRLDRRHLVRLLLDAACAGDTTADVRERVALPQVADALADAELVTLTLGGNDVGFAQYLGACSTAGEQAQPGACDVLLAQAPARIGTAAASAGMTLAVIDQATDGVVVVLGYPRLLGGTSDTPFFTAVRAGQLDGLSDELNEALRRAAVAEGARFADVRPRFARHGISSDDPWLVFDPAAPTGPGSFHPTSEGYVDGYYPALVRAVPWGRLARR